jgi:hypothetical protein
MHRIHCRAVLIAGLGLSLLAGVPEPASAGPDDKLSQFDFLLLGLSLRPEPDFQVIPRNTQTGVRIVLGFSDSSADASGLLALLPAGLEVAAELVGPGIDAPIALRGPPGGLLPIPALVTRGLYLVRDIRLEKDGVTFLRAVPDSATIEVVDQILITQVTTRPLTLEEIRQKGILFGDDDFTGFNFMIAFKLDSRLVTVDLPFIFDSNNILVPIPGSRDIGLTGLGVPGLGGGLVPMMLDVDSDGAGASELEFPELADLTVPGLLLIPGEVGFLNQFFSALLLVSNGAPEDSALVVSDLEATMELPAGDDQVPGTADDPLVVAETMTGKAFTLPIRGVGPDGAIGTGDDTDRFGPGEQGEAERSFRTGRAGRGGASGPGPQRRISHDFFRPRRHAGRAVWAAAYPRVCSWRRAGKKPFLQHDVHRAVHRAIGRGVLSLCHGDQYLAGHSQSRQRHSQSSLAGRCDHPGRPLARHRHAASG